VKPVRHGGDLASASTRFGLAPEDFLDFSASVSPLGVPEGVREAILRGIARLPEYPDPSCRTLVRALARLHERNEDEILVTNGATEALSLALRAIRPRRVGILAPAYRDIERAAAQEGAKVSFLRASGSRGFTHDWDAAARWARGRDLVALGTPNNPTGRATAPDVLSRLAEAVPGTVFLLDEAFLDFLDAPEAWSLARGTAASDNVLVLRSFTKFYAVPGLRLGYAVGDRKLIRCLREAGEPWSVNSLAQAAGLACLEEAAYARRLRALVREEREFLSEGLSRMGFTVYPSQANFLLVRLPGPAGAWAERLGRLGILVRDASDFPGLGRNHVRLAVRTRPENRRLLAAMGERVSA
jgi:threonine-phosphate decarboxylase